MGKNLHRYIDYSESPKKKASGLEKYFEDYYENFPFREGVAHYRTFRYKRAFLNKSLIENLLKKHVNEEYTVIYGDIAKMFKTGSLERKHIENELIWMSEPDSSDYIYREGYYIIDGIIRLVKKEKNKFVVCK